MRGGRGAGLEDRSRVVAVEDDPVDARTLQDATTAHKDRRFYVVGSIRENKMQIVGVHDTVDVGGGSARPARKVGGGLVVR